MLFNEVCRTEEIHNEADRIHEAATTLLQLTKPHFLNASGREGGRGTNTSEKPSAPHLLNPRRGAAEKVVSMKGIEASESVRSAATHVRGPAKSLKNVWDMMCHSKKRDRPHKDEAGQYTMTAPIAEYLTVSR